MTALEKVEFDFPLTTGFTYSRGGGQEEATFVKLLAPTSRNSREGGALFQAFGRAQTELAERRAVTTAATSKAQEESDAEDITGEDVILMLAASSSVEYPDVLDVARKLFSSGVALVDGETKLTGGLMDRMSLVDFERMLGEYLVNFTLASLLSKTKGSSSPGS